MSVVSTLCTTGLTMGIVHVLTGPDHLSAIATLSVNVGNGHAFWVGIRWGMGHSIGLVVVGSIFILLENLHYQNYNTTGNNNNTRVIEIPDRLEHLAACFVGIFMLALGCYNWNRAYQRHQLRRQRSQDSVAAVTTAAVDHAVEADHRCGGESYDLLISKMANTNTNNNQHNLQNYGDDNNNDDEEEGPKVGGGSFVLSPLGKSAVGIKNDDDNQHRHSLNHSHHHHHHYHHRINDANGNATNEYEKEEEKEGITKKFLSLWIGIFHGVAGPGGVLGVIPAIKLHNVVHSVVYLGSFCTSSILVMGCVAAGYGCLSARYTQHNDLLTYRVEVVSAFCSVLVGITWLLLLYLGILDEVFP